MTFTAFLLVDVWSTLKRVFVCLDNLYNIRKMPRYLTDWQIFAHAQSLLFRKQNISFLFSLVDLWAEAVTHRDLDLRMTSETPGACVVSGIWCPREGISLYPTVPPRWPVYHCHTTDQVKIPYGDHSEYYKCPDIHNTSVRQPVPQIFWIILPCKGLFNNVKTRNLTFTPNYSDTKRHFTSQNDDKFKVCNVNLIIFFMCNVKS